MYSPYKIAECVAEAVQRDPSLGDEADVHKIMLAHNMSRRGGDSITLTMANGQVFVLTVEEVK